MLKYVDTKVTFSEIPDEITLCIGISGCPIKCEGCHSSYLTEDIGTKLSIRGLHQLINSNDGITCVCFMGGDADPKFIKDLAFIISMQYPKLKTAWYSGRSTIEELDLDLADWNYIKVGPYIKEKGPLNNPNTNQRLYEVKENKGKFELLDITSRFWKND